MLQELWNKSKPRNIKSLQINLQAKSVDPKLRKEVLVEAEKYLNFNWPPLTATKYMEYLRCGDRAGYEALYFLRRRALALLVLGECLERQGRFVDDIINGIWCICEESSWVLPAHHNQFYQDPGQNSLPKVEEPVIDLFAAETGALLSLTKSLLGVTLQGVSKQILKRISRELEERIKGPYLVRDDFWWMGIHTTGYTLGNWVPWTTGNCLLVFLLDEPSERRRQQAVQKGLYSLDRYLEAYSPDGGCDEGPSYWGRSGGSLFECLEMLWQATEGDFDAFNLDLVKKIGRYITKVHIAHDYFVNFADGSAKAEVDGPILYAYGKRCQDQDLLSLGAWIHQRVGFTGLIKAENFSLARVLRGILLHGEIWQYDEPRPQREKSYWLDSLQVMTTRENLHPPQGFYLAAKGGHNGENHNHNDLGSCIIFYNGSPLVIDVGVERYTAKTFSSKRYEIWTMQSQYHNLPIINGHGQAPGNEYHIKNPTFSDGKKQTSLRLDLATAYPKESGILKWQRTYTLKRAPESGIVIEDDYILDYAQQLEVVFMLAEEPQLGGDFIKLFAGNDTFKLEIDCQHCRCISETIPVVDDRLLAVWGNKLYRLRVIVQEPTKEGRMLFTMRQTGGIKCE